MFVGKRSSSSHWRSISEQIRHPSNAEGMQALYLFHSCIALLSFFLVQGPTNYLIVNDQDNLLKEERG